MQCVKARVSGHAVDNLVQCYQNIFRKCSQFRKLGAKSNFEGAGFWLGQESKIDVFETVLGYFKKTSPLFRRYFFQSRDITAFGKTGMEDREHNFGFRGVKRECLRWGQKHRHHIP